MCVLVDEGVESPLSGAIAVAGRAAVPRNHLISDLKRSLPTVSAEMWIFAGNKFLPGRSVDRLWFSRCRLQG